MIELPCPHCGEDLLAKGEWAGRRIKCPSCGGKLLLPPAPVPERAASSLSTAELIKEITSQFGHLAKKQLELAKTELRADAKERFAAER